MNSKKIRKGIAFLLVFAMLLGCMSVPGIGTVTVKAATEDYSYDEATKTLTVYTNGGTISWHLDSNFATMKKELTTVKVMDGVTEIGQRAFDNCEVMTGVTLPDGLTKIGDYAFDNCKAMTGVTLPDGVEEIGQRAFRNCQAMTEVTLPDSLTTIGASAFNACNLKRITIPKNVTKISSGMLGSNSALEEVTLLDGITEIGESGFYGCSSLKTIDLPERVNTIGERAFYNCGLTTIKIPDGVTTIEKETFSYCSDLTSVELPRSLTTIGVSAFYGCTGLENIELLSGVKVIEAKAFSSCKGLTSVELPTGLTTIKEKTFLDCTGLTRIELPSCLTTIGEYAFKNCTGLTSIELPDQVSLIQSGAFSGCSNLMEVKVDGKTPATLNPSGSNGSNAVFYNCGFYNASGDDQKGIKVFSDVYDDYCNPGKWGNWRSYIAGVERNDTDRLNEAVRVTKRVLASEKPTNDTNGSDIVTKITEKVEDLGYGITVSAEPEGLTKTEATKVNSGSITGTITLTLASDSRPVGVDLIIPKLPKTDDDKLNEAKLAAQAALDAMTADNNTEEATVLEAVKKEVDKLGYGIEVTLSNFEKKNATTSNQGSVTGKIVLKLNDAQREVPVKLEIGMLPKQKFTITATAGDNGSISPSGDVAVTEGESKTFTITPDDGYEIDTLTVDNKAVTASTSYTFSDVRANHTIAVTFKQKSQTPEPGEDTYTVTAANDGNGTATVSGNTTVAAGTEVTIQAVPNSGYHFDKWEVTSGNAVTFTGGTSNTSATAKFIMPAENIVIKAVFARTTSGGGSSSGSAPSTPSIGGTTITVPVSGSDNIVNVTTKVEGSKATVDEIKSEEIKKVTEGDKAANIEVDLTGLNKKIDTVILPNKSMEEIAKAAADKTSKVEGLTVKLSTATVELDATALNAVVEQSKGDDIQLNVDDAGTSRLNEAQKAGVEKLDIHAGIEAYFTCNGQRIGDFKGGKANVKIPFAIPQGYKAAGFSVWYVADDGKTTKYASSYKDGHLAFTVDHFSDFLIVYDEADAQKAEEAEKEETEKTEETENGDSTEVITVDNTYRKLRLRVPTTTKTTNVLKWTKVSEADGYVIYGNKCNTKGKTYKMLKQAVIKDNATTTWTDKKLTSGTYYKYYIKAYKLVDGKKVWIAKSKVVHSTTTGGKYGNAKSVKVNKTAVSLAVGKTFTIKAEQVVKDQPIKKHTDIKFESSNSKVASVTSKGVIKAKKKGTCYIYVYAQNGIYKKIKVTVK